jgi:hypothetical protein
MDLGLQSLIDAASVSETSVNSRIRTIKYRVGVETKAVEAIGMADMRDTMMGVFN